MPGHDMALPGNTGDAMRYAAAIQVAGCGSCHRCKPFPWPLGTDMHGIVYMSNASVHVYSQTWHLHVSVTRHEHCAGRALSTRTRGHGPITYAAADSDTQVVPCRELCCLGGRRHGKGRVGIESKLACGSASCYFPPTHARASAPVCTNNKTIGEGRLRLDSVSRSR